MIGISDGDTITILDVHKQQHKVRLYGIDCPESGQAFGQTAKKHTASLTAGKTVGVEAYDTERYGRVVGVVTVKGVNVNRSLLETGYAWQYRNYCKKPFCTEWLKVEDTARNEGRDLWADARPVAPWPGFAVCGNTPRRKDRWGAGFRVTPKNGVCLQLSGLLIHRFNAKNLCW